MIVECKYKIEKYGNAKYSTYIQMCTIQQFIHYLKNNKNNKKNFTFYYQNKLNKLTKIKYHITKL